MQNNATQDVMDSKIRAASNKITYLIDSIEDPTRDMGMELFYDSSKLHVTLQANKGKWIIEAPYDLKLDTLYRIQVSWHPTGTLSLYVDGFLISETKRVSKGQLLPVKTSISWPGEKRSTRQHYRAIRALNLDVHKRCSSAARINTRLLCNSRNNPVCRLD